MFFLFLAPEIRPYIHVNVLNIQHSEKNGAKIVPKGYYLIVRKTVPYFGTTKRVLFSTQFLYKNGASMVLNMIIKEKKVPLCEKGTIFQSSTQRVLF